jgi:type IV pilus assembly protein PilO
MNIRIPLKWREFLASMLTWHYVVFVALLVTVISLSIRLGMDWKATNSRSTEVLQTKQMDLKALELQTTPLQGLGQRVEDSRTQAQSFYLNRIPPSYSSIAARIGELALKGPVRLTRVQYTQGPPGSELTEISMDAGITGDYPQIMRFVNSVERDQTFFVIRAMSLTGQRGGVVNLRLRVSTWLRPADAAASGLAATPSPNDAAATPIAREKEGE